jgi:hypothetical protein
LTDIFADAHRKAAQDAIRKQAADESKALTEAAKTRMTANAGKRKENPNNDIIGIPLRPKFYPDQNVRFSPQPTEYEYVLGPV